MTGWFLGLRYLGAHLWAAQDRHAEYAAKVGSDQIASAFAIGVIDALCAKIEPASILEVGAGIGTLTSMLAGYGSVEYVEDDDWCRNILAHLPARELAHQGFNRRFALAVVDGPQLMPSRLEPMMLAGSWVVVEGNRRRWRELFSRACRVMGRPCISVNLRPFDRSKGVWLIKLNPTAWDRVAFGLERVWQWTLEAAVRLTGSENRRGKRRAMETA